MEIELFHENPYLAENIDNDISRNIHNAYNLQRSFGQAFHNDEDLQKLLFRLEQNIEATRKEMIESGIVMECAACAVSEDDTCCGRRTGYKYDGILLLVNLLLGISLPIKPQDSHYCYFLEKEGCILKARHVICVNYLCQRLRYNIQLERLIRLQEIAGEELTALFVLEEYIKKEY